MHKRSAFVADNDGLIQLRRVGTRKRVFGFQVRKLPICLTTEPFRLRGPSYMKEVPTERADSPLGANGGVDGGGGLLIQKSQSDTRSTQARNRGWE
jgi:hypothetical protein